MEESSPVDDDRLKVNHEFVRGEEGTGSGSSTPGISGLSMMMEREKARSALSGNSPIKEVTELEEEATPKPSRHQSELGSEADSSRTELAPSSTTTDALVPENLEGTLDSDGTGESTPEFDAPNGPILIEPTAEEEAETSSKLRHYLASTASHTDEETPLLEPDSAKTTRSPDGKRVESRNIVKRANWELRRRMKKLTWMDVASACLLDPLKTLPSVILGMLLNVLDGVSYGMIL